MNDILTGFQLIRYIQYRDAECLPEPQRRNRTTSPLTRLIAALRSRTANKS